MFFSLSMKRIASCSKYNIPNLQSVFAQLDPSGVSSLRPRRGPHVVEQDSDDQSTAPAIHLSLG